MEWILAILKGLPIIRDLIEILTGWVSGVKKWWNQRQFEKRRRRIDEAVQKAESESNTEDLQKELEDLL